MKKADTYRKSYDFDEGKNKVLFAFLNIHTLQ
jgi:hypothetical protein